MWQTQAVALKKICIIVQTVAVRISPGLYESLFNRCYGSSEIDKKKEKLSFSFIVLSIKYVVQVRQMALHIECNIQLHPGRLKADST